MNAAPKSANTYEVLTLPTDTSASTNDLCYFRTRSGNAGILQIIGYIGNPCAIKLRYKLVQNVVSGFTNAFQPPGNPGIPAPVANLPLQIGGEPQPPGAIAAASAPVAVTGKLVLLAAPVLGLFLILAVIVTVLLPALKKSKSGAGKAVAIGCGVLVLGGFLSRSWRRPCSSG